MATRRMLHNKISISLEVNKLALEAQLLFTWLISHADDEGRLRGEPEYVKATVVPMKDWTFDAIANYLNQMQQQGLIHYWEEDGRMIIQLIKWTQHQTLRPDRLKTSTLPTFRIDGQSSDNRPSFDNQLTAQANISESNKEEIKKSELKHIADKSFIDPNNYRPGNAEELAALEAWRKLEPDNKSAFFTTYLSAARNGIKAHMIYRFTSEIQQDKTIKNKGSVFQSKVKSII